MLDAESVELELSAIAALRGDVVISTAKLVRPILYVEPLGQNRYAPVAPKGGRIRHAIEEARAVVAANPADPGRSRRSPSESFGTVEFADGQVMADRRNRRRGDADRDRACRRHRMERAQPHGELVGDRHLARRELLGRRLARPSR